ncbi:hypothetical protein [Pseudothauera lacus]|nr:hypothetical protein [Pseudothauera lacus]
MTTSFVDDIEIIGGVRTNANGIYAAAAGVLLAEYKLMIIYLCEIHS